MVEKVYMVEIHKSPEGEKKKYSGLTFPEGLTPPSL